MASTCHPRISHDNRSNRNDRHGLGTARQADCGLAAEADQAGDQKDYCQDQEDAWQVSAYSLCSPEVLAQRLRNQALRQARDLMG